MGLTSEKAHTLATPNYGYEKRQRELAKRKKKKKNCVPNGGPRYGTNDAPPMAWPKTPWPARHPGSEGTSSS